MSKSRGSARSAAGYAPAPSEDEDETESIYSSKPKGGKAVEGKSAAQRRWRNMLVFMFAADIAASAGLYEMTHDFKGTCESECSSRPA